MSARPTKLHGLLELSRAGWEVPRWVIALVGAALVIGGLLYFVIKGRAPR